MMNNFIRIELGRGTGHDTFHLKWERILKDVDKVFETINRSFDKLDV